MLGLRLAARHLWRPLVLVAAVLTADLVLDAAWAPWTQIPLRPDWLPLVGADFWYPLVVALATVAVSRHASGRFPSNLNWLMVIAALTLMLGSAAYWPAVAEHSPIEYFTWVLDLFTSTDADTIAGVPPRAFLFARLGGVLTVIVAAVSVAMRVWRTQFDRWLSQIGLDLDVVVGANPLTLELARQLVRERQAEPLDPPWRRWTARQLVTRWVVRLVSGVVLVHPNRDDPVIADFRSVGCRVLISPPNAQVMKALSVTGGRPAVRRVFAAARSEADNRRLVQGLRDVLEGDVSAPPRRRSQRLVTRPLRWLLGVLVPRGALGSPPRLVAVMDDPREAREFRLAHLNVHRSFVDALCPDELLARDLVAAIDRYRRGHVVVLGGGAMTLALLDEIALQGAFRREVERRAPQALQVVQPFSIRRVTIADPDAPLLKAEWERFRTPASLHPRIEVKAITASWDDALEGLGADALAVLITAEASAAVRARASRINRLHPEALVFCPDERTDGLDLTADAPDVSGRVVLGFGPSLLQGGHVPEDYWTVLARQTHEVYSRANPARLASRRPWGVAATKEEDRLPAFLREDNISQQRNVMALVAGLPAFQGRGPAWQSITAGELRRTLSNADLTAIARAEHGRWCSARLATGWEWDDGTLPPAESEWRARNANLVDWDTGAPLGRRGHRFTGGPAEVVGVRQCNVDSVAEIMARLYLAGFAPTRSAAMKAQRFRRLPVKVGATRLEEPRLWTTRNGSALVASPGDWWVTDAHGDSRSVAAAEFERLYRKLDRPEGHYTHEKSGIVWGYQSDTPAEIITLEGDALARAGDWIVLDHGTMWPVPDEHLRASYGPLIDPPVFPLAKGPLR